jgi:hypothetical protein
MVYGIFVEVADERHIDKRFDHYLGRILLHKMDRYLFKIFGHALRAHDGFINNYVAQVLQHEHDCLWHQFGVVFVANTLLKISGRVLKLPGEGQIDFKLWVINVDAAEQSQEFLLCTLHD